MKKAHSLFCPFCNAKGNAQPVLSPMSVTEIRIAPTASGDDGKVPFFSYRCERCGFSEIHQRAVDAA